ncbi:hypothetical protein JRO89_XS03G0032400 [Xanthoceras sorbifolium]|uniref:BHLH domain-containing protein n=1 Tax=Xanthoceras sorbifolium TaxID=99658 RepID=A0ABQ8I8F5_9ROSI|nr:hypothetical protein JRO89_XS03G0032400 [Xanthoceras sorbifolium]
MMENKRSPCSVDQGSITTLASKRHKADLSISAKVFFSFFPSLFYFSAWGMFFSTLLIDIVSVSISRALSSVLVYPSGIMFLQTVDVRVLLELLRERKEKLGERIVALQQLVSPYGKTDTASVLWDAMEYIQFLHEQVKVLSAPYLQSTPTVKFQELEHHSLKNRGLCLVPISCTAGVAGSNGADIWAPIKTTSPKFEKAITQFQ